MKRSYAFLCSLIICGSVILATPSAKAIPIVIAKGEDDILRRAGIPSYYGQLERFHDQRRLKYFRFHDPQTGPLQTHIPLHPHALDWDKQEEWLLPQTYRAALLQSLFPSPDGVNFIANQINMDVDPIGGLKDPKHMGHLLRLIEDELAAPTSQDKFRHDLYTFLSNKLLSKAHRLSMDDIRPFYPDFIRLDVLNSYAHFLRTFLDELDEESWAEEGVTRESPTVLDDAAHKHDGGKYLLAQGFLKPGTLDSIYHASHPLSADQINRNLNLRLYRFVDILAQALEEQRHHSSSYPSFFVQRMLIGFFTAKAKTREDILIFLKAVFPEKIDMKELSSLPVYQEADYHALRHNNQFLEEYTLTPEVLLFLDQGYDLFENPLPPPIPQGVGIYQSNRFTDCVEMSIFETLNYFTRQKRGSRYIYDPTVFHKNKRLSEFYGNSTSESLITTEARNTFNNIISNIPKIRYQKKTHEMPVGWINSLNAIFALLDGEEDVPMPFEPNDDLLKARLTDLCRRFSRDDTLFGYELSPYVAFSKESQDYLDTVTFTVNGIPTFKWLQSRWTSDIQRLIDPKPDWKTKIPVLDLLQRPNLRDYLPSVVHENSLASTLKACKTPEEKSMVFSALNLDPLYMKLAVIRAIYGDDPTLRPHAHGLINAILLASRVHDITYRLILHKTLLGFWVKNPNRDHALEEQDSVTIMNLWPDMFNTNIDDFEQEPPSADEPTRTMSFLHWAVYHHKLSWIEVARQRLSFISNIHLDVSNLSFVDFYIEIINSFKQLSEIKYMRLIDDEAGTCALKFSKAPLLLSKVQNLSLRQDRLSSMPTQSTLTVLRNELPLLTSFYLEGSTVKMTECRRILALFFLNHPKAKFTFRQGNCFTAAQKTGLFRILDNKGIGRDLLIFEPNGDPPHSSVKCNIL